ncbi:MAG: cadmium-translocating P-type ATPase [Zoogloeaceae bacterium]|jgi:Cu2+-exporting ATPase|nr:cadmium-translocating P-type ATPase [Zoogloeaceae bacterium]
MSEPCYHCGLPIPDGFSAQVDINGALRPMCCTGCQAVAQTLVDNGLAAYYTSRDALPESPREARPAVLDQLALFDHAEFQKSFVRELSEHEKEASLMLEGITCAACVWVNERHIGQLPGVVGVSVNYATRRARVRWDDQKIKLSDILSAIAAIGYRAQPYDANRYEELAQKEKKRAVWRLWVAGFGMMQVMMYAIPAYIAGPDGMSADIAALIRWASLILTLPVVFYAAAPFFAGAWRDLKLKRVGMDTPVALGIGVSFLASCWATLTHTGEVYFDSIAMFTFFLLGGRFLEMTARQKAVSVTEALAKLLPAFCRKLPDYPASREPVECLVAELAEGDVALVRPGDILPADGVLLEGETKVGEALLTGESAPVKKRPGEALTGGSENLENPVLMRVTAVGQATRLSAIVALMERAAAEKPKLAQTADKIAQWFVGGLLLVAALVFVVWLQIDAARALWITVSVLVVTCPCALALATPISLTVAAGALAREGLLITRGHAIETLARADTFVFDKTGTLTEGRMRLLETQASGWSADEAVAIAAALEQSSTHPIARAFLAAAPNLSLLDATQVEAQAGKGLAGEVAGARWKLGRPDFAAPAQALPADWAGQTAIALSDAEGRRTALFRLGDELRPEAADLVAALKAQGGRVVLLTGDAEDVARRIAGRLGIDEFSARCSPEEKREAVRRLQAEGRVVAMVGDGVNDAPVLAQAQVSVAMGEGTELARSKADCVLLSNHLAQLRQALGTSRKTLRIIRENLAWALVYNAVALPLAAWGHVEPWAAGIGMSMSSLLVVANALRLQKPDKRQTSAVGAAYLPEGKN